MAGVFHLCLKDPVSFFHVPCSICTGIQAALVLIFDLLSTYSVASWKPSCFHLNLPLKSQNIDN